MKKHLFLNVLIVLIGLTLYVTPSAFSQPDLVVTSITHTPRYPTTSDFVIFTVTILNQGNQQAGACILDVTLTGPKTTTHTINAPILASGASWSTQFTQKLVPKGTYTVTATVDFTNVVAESNETNNVKILNVTSITPNKEDLVVEVLTWTPPNPIETDTITITAGVKNIGPSQAAASTLQLQVGTETTPPTYAIPALDSGVTHEIQRQVVLAPGAYQITATADFYDVINESDENNNVTIETITVAVIPKPDLIVFSLTHSPANPTITDTITITAIVQNTGIADSTTSTLAIDVTGDANPTTYTVPILAPTQTFQVQRVLSPTAGGIHQVTATADADDDNMESDETNNQATDNIIVSAPDLIVSSLSHLPVGPTNIDTITITAIVENDGDTSAGASNLEIDVQGNAVNYAVPSLNPSQTHQVQRQIVLGTSGSYLVTTTADIDNSVTESNEDNNETTETINVIEAADLIITTLTHVPADPTITDTITLTVIVRNRGGITAGASTLEIDVDGEATPTTYTVPSLSPSQTHQVQRQINLTMPGNYQVTATADLNDDVAESNENNNTAIDNIQVTAPDLVVGSLTHSPADPTNLDTITITALVENIGDATATTSTLEIDVDGGALNYKIPVLDPSETHQIQRLISLTPGSYQVTATADLLEDVTESDEDNNVTTDTINVVEAPDLMIQSLTHAPADPTISDTITITAIVQNMGGKVSLASTLEIDVDGDVTTHTISSLNPSQTQQIQRQVNLTSPGIYPVTASADSVDDVAESNEGNNTAQDSITVHDLPDLIVSDLSYTPDIAVINEDITIKAEVRNAGLVAATTSTLSILVGSELVPAMYEIPPLDAGTTCTVERHISFDTIGSYPVTATADADEEVQETSEDNNDASILIEVYEWDLGILRNYLLKRIEFTEFQKRLYDVNKDGKLDVGDLVLLIIKLDIV